MITAKRSIRTFGKNRNIRGGKKEEERTELSEEEKTRKKEQNYPGRRKKRGRKNRTIRGGGASESKNCVTGKKYDLIMQFVFGDFIIYMLTIQEKVQNVDGESRDNRVGRALAGKGIRQNRSATSGTG